MRILLVGGGTGGPVSPLLAVAEEIRKNHPKTEFLLVGSNRGPEREMAKSHSMPFAKIFAGKYRRYFSLKNLVTPFSTGVGFFQALYLIKKFKPDCVFGAGSFIQVPVIWAAWLCRIPCLIHQQDFIPSLANKLCQMAAKKITVSFEESLKDFGSGFGLFYKKNKQEKIIFTGNPIRFQEKPASKSAALKFFGLNPEMPVLFVTGGGTGSIYLNSLVEKALPKLTKTVQVIHLTGANKNKKIKHENYQQYDFLNRMDMAFAAADLVLSRAGLSTISELSYFKKVAILIPLPKTHQEINAQYLELKQAAIAFDQNEMTPDGLVFVVRKLLFKYEMQQQLAKNLFSLMPHDAAQNIAAEIIKLSQKKSG